MGGGAGRAAGVGGVAGRAGGGVAGRAIGGAGGGVIGRAGGATGLGAAGFGAAGVAAAALRAFLGAEAFLAALRAPAARFLAVLRPAATLRVVRRAAVLRVAALRALARFIAEVAARFIFFSVPAPELRFLLDFAMIIVLHVASLSLWTKRAHNKTLPPLGRTIFTRPARVRALSHSHAARFARPAASGRQLPNRRVPQDERWESPLPGRFAPCIRGCWWRSRRAWCVRYWPPCAPPAPARSRAGACCRCRPSRSTSAPRVRP